MRRIWIGLGVAIGLSVVVSYGAVFAQRQNKLDRLVICVRFRGADPSINRESLRKNIDELVSSGSSWSDAYALVATIVGCGAGNPNGVAR